MGCRELRLAACPEYDPVPVRTWSLTAWPLYEQARRYASLDAALHDVAYAAAFSRRGGQHRKQAVDIRPWAVRQAEVSTGPGALVFGNERDGLSTAELALCDEAVFIPTDPALPSLNVAQAVQLACWELRRLEAPGGRGRVPALRTELVPELDGLMERLAASGFFKIGGREDTGVFLRELCARAALSTAELRRFVGLFGKYAALAEGRRVADRSAAEQP
jgi:tRNA C32,U32 (ribose-2'-O)-methylase TrmJ